VGPQNIASVFVVIEINMLAINAILLRFNRLTRLNINLAKPTEDSHAPMGWFASISHLYEYVGFVLIFYETCLFLPKLLIIKTIVRAV
jgi:hypothetical protein